MPRGRNACTHSDTASSAIVIRQPELLAGSTSNRTRVREWPSSGIQDEQAPRVADPQDRRVLERQRPGTDGVVQLAALLGPAAVHGTGMGGPDHPARVAEAVAQDPAYSCD